MNIVPCVICGGKLPPHKAGARRVACPGACAAERNKQKMRESYERRRDAGLLTEIRARSYKKWREANPERVAEMLKTWREGKAEHIAEYERRYRRENAESIRAKNQRRRSLLMGAFVEEVNLPELFARDAGICGICDLAVDPEVQWPHKMSKTLDHIVPLSKGGEHSWANAQLAHAVCNSRKNNRISA